MRITNRMMTDNLTENLAQAERRMVAAQNQLTGGKRISRPSDDPHGTGLALGYHARIDAGQQYLRTIDSSMAWVQASEAPLDTATELMQRAHELAVQASNDTLGPNDQAAIASEVDGLLRSMAQLGNTSLRGQRLFAGTKTDADPLSLSSGSPTTVTYSGDNGPMNREIDVGQTVDISVPGSVFASAASSLISLRDHVLAGDTTSVRTIDLPGVDGGMRQVLDARTRIGVTSNRLDATRDRLNLQHEQTAAALSQVEDVDFAQAASELTLQQTVYQAALAASARAMQTSLLDYLH